MKNLIKKSKALGASIADKAKSIDTSKLADASAKSKDIFESLKTHEKTTTLASKFKQAKAKLTEKLEK
jgi:hypothetical protein|tara:strand:- start:41971 stop:42174 length:204 start_codon:yes stop_codon:yes gene_type:complete